MRNLDVLVFDIQDAGARFYTYETTLGYFLEAAAKAGKPIVVLDRPNPAEWRLRAGPGLRRWAGELRRTTTVWQSDTV